MGEIIKAVGMFINLTSSRTKTSLLEYSELMMISITLETFDSNLKFSGSTSAVTSLATFNAELRNVLIPFAVGNAMRVVTCTRGKNASVFATSTSNDKLHRKFMLANAQTAYEFDLQSVANSSVLALLFCYFSRICVGADHTSHKCHLAALRDHSTHYLVH
jgi:hypothetical protein